MTGMTHEEWAAEVTRMTGKNETELWDMYVDRLMSKGHAGVQRFEDAVQKVVGEVALDLNITVHESSYLYFYLSVKNID